MSKWLIILSSFGYLGLLFLIAWWAERNARKKKWLSGSGVYALSLAVYCTAWTYYGSVGHAANQGLSFLTTYIGPTLMAPFFWILLRKIIRICKTQRITTIADFVATRYGKSKSLGALITLVCFVGILPYISIQLKAISNSFTILLQGSLESRASLAFFYDTSFYITLALILFTILFGARKIDTTEKNVGLISAIAFESVFKLLAFLAVGIFVTYGIFDGFKDIFQRAELLLPSAHKLLAIDPDRGYTDWMLLNVLAMFAIVFLPRQFHVSVKENHDERHLKKATWMFPLYLLLINIFVIPIALGGNLLFVDNPIDADTFVLAIPLAHDQLGIALFTHLGGFSAATSMVIISSTAMSIMFSNNLLMPLVVKSSTLTRSLQERMSPLLLQSRRAVITALLLMAYLYYKYVGESFSLVSIGLISFVAVAQFAPLIIGGIYWKGGTRQGAITGIIVGFVIWTYTLVFPTMVSAGFLPEGVMNHDLPWLHPETLFGITSLSPIPLAFFCSLLLNSLSYYTVSLITSQTSQERNQAEVYVDIFKYSTVFESSIVWKGTAYQEDIKALVSRFIGPERTDRLFTQFMKENQIDALPQQADFRLVNYAENLLAGVVGSASARVLVASVVKEEEISLEEVLDMLQESQQIKILNRELEKKSTALVEAGEQLKTANQELVKLDRLKDEFISMVTHEMRTPITSIRAFSEILLDNPDLNDKEKARFFQTIIKETDRMDRLINQVLDLEKMESGKIKINLSPQNLNDIIRESLNSLDQVICEKNIILHRSLKDDLPLVYGNRDRLVQVMLNLVSNAVKFCNDERGEIRVFSGNGQDVVKISVQDNGAGVPSESRGLIFEAFYQAKNQSTRKPKGSGLGLSICKKIIEKHQGNIWVEEANGGGAIFNFILPKIK